MRVCHGVFSLFSYPLIESRTCCILLIFSLYSSCTTDSQTSLQQQQGYTCSICQQHPFLSPEELGTHAALCYPADVSHFVNHYLAQPQGQGQPGRYNHQSANKKLLLQQRLQRIRQQTRPVLSAPSSTTASAAAIADEEEAEEVLAIEDSGSEVDSEEEDEEVRAVVPVEDVVGKKSFFISNRSIPT